MIVLVFNSRPKKREREHIHTRMVCSTSEQRVHLAMSVLFKANVLRWKEKWSLTGQWFGHGKSQTHL